MKKKRLVIFLIIIMSCIYAGCSSSSHSESAVQEEQKENYSEMTFYDIYGKEYSDIFKEHKLTIVNLFGTWCPPCVQEIPELQKLSENLANQDIAVVSIVTDAYMDGKRQEDVITSAKEIAQTAGVTYPFLLPDESNFKGYIDSMMIFPETLFIDKEGNIIESVEGSNDLKGWTKIVEKVVNKLEK